MKKFTKILSLVLAMIMILSMTACGTKTPDSTDPATNPANPIETTPEESEAIETTTPIETQPDNVAENPLTFFSMTFDISSNDNHSITAFANEDGTVYVEYVGEEKKVGEMEAVVLYDIAEALKKTELASLNKFEYYSEGEENGSMYIEFADGSTLTADFVGEVPTAYRNGYATMEKFFQDITASIPVYTPRPQIMGEIDEEISKEMLTILVGGGMPNLDGIAISAIDTADAFFGDAAGLTNANGIASAASAAPTMMAQAYSLVIVKLEDANAAENVAKDFENNIDWRKWVCVAPENGLIAAKDDMVLCMLGSGELYALTENSIKNTGWIKVNELENPDLV